MDESYAPCCQVQRGRDSWVREQPRKHLSPSRHPLVVTSSGKLARDGEIERTEAFARRIGVPHLRYQRNVPAEKLLEQADAVLVVQADGLLLLDPGGRCRFSAGMAEIRIRRIDDGIDQTDYVVSLGELRAGDAVLDCTLGFAQDARVCARVVGPTGRVVGLEKSLPLYALVSEGLAREELWPGSCRIEVDHADSARRLRELPDGSFDVVYFDPMFSKPGRSQPDFARLRHHADNAPLTREMLADAQRVARRWVIIKAAPYSRDLRELGLAQVPHARSADLRFARLPGARNR